jgi:hypothetical protein
VAPAAAALALALDILAREGFDHLLAEKIASQHHRSEHFVDCQQHQVFMQGSTEFFFEYFTTNNAEGGPHGRSPYVAGNLASLLSFP